MYKSVSKAQGGARVHVGYSGTGRSKWLYFPTLDEAQDYANYVTETAGWVLLVQEIPRYIEHVTTAGQSWAYTD